MHVARSTSTISFAPSDGKPSDAVLSIEQTASYFYILLEGKGSIESIPEKKSSSTKIVARITKAILRVSSHP